MSLCQNCSSVEPIQDEGAIVLRTESDTCTDKLLQFLARHDISYDRSNDMYLLPYSSKEKLLVLLSSIKEGVDDRIQNELKFGVRRGINVPLHQVRFSTLTQFFSLIQNHDLVTIIQQGRFTSHMQPIVDIRDKRTFGYEFVLRPAGEFPFKPYELFQVAQETGLHSFLDRQARISAIQASVGVLPNGIKRFINFLPSSIYNPNYCLSHTFEAVEKYNLNPTDFVFEVVETERILDMEHLQSIFRVYQRNGMKVALDDVGSGFATVEALEQLKPDFVKIDRDLISDCDTNDTKQKKLAEIMRVSRSLGAQVLAEGIERKEEYLFVLDLGIDLAQGYLFGKPAPQPHQTDWASNQL